MAKDSMIKKFTIGLFSDNKGLMSGLAEADKSIAAFASKAGKILGGLGVGAGFGKIISDFTSIGNDLKLFTDSTGIAVEEVSRLGLALEQFGGDTNTAMASINGLQDSIRAAADWGQGPLMDVMGRYGVSIINDDGTIKDAVDMYYSLADAMQGLTKAQQIDLGRAAGLDDASIKLLQQGREGVQALLDDVSDLAVMTEEDAQAAREWTMTLTRLKQTFTGISRTIARAAMPVLQKFADLGKRLSKFLEDNREIIDSVANAIANNLVPAFTFAMLKIGASMAPLLIKMAPLIALAMLIDDIAVFMRNDGGKSVIGTIFSEDGQKTLRQLFGGVGDLVTGILSGDWDKVAKAWEEGIKPALAKIGNALFDTFKDAWKRFTEWLGDLWDGVKNWLSGIYVEDYTKQGKTYDELADKVVQDTVENNNRTSSQTVNAPVEININAAKMTAEELRASVSNGVSNGLLGAIAGLSPA